MEFSDDGEWSGENEDNGDFEEDLLKDKGDEEESQMMIINPCIKWSLN